MTSYHFNGRTGEFIGTSEPNVGTSPDGRRNTTMPKAPKNPNHTATGKFAPGNRAGKGNSSALRQQQLRQSLEQVIGTEQVADVVAGLLKAARGGDVQAAGLLLAYSLGKPRPTPPRAEIGPLEATTAAGVVASFQAILAGVAQGQLELDSAAELGRIVEQAARATCWQSIEERLARVEAAK